MSTNKGKVFESQFKASVPDYCLLIRLNDPPQALKKSSALRFVPSNPCDYLAFDSKRKMFLPIELKSTKSKSMPYSMIRDNQITSLKKFAEYDGCVPGFLFNYRDDEKHFERCYFMHIYDFNKMMRDTDKKSFNEIDVLLNGVIKVDGSKARTRWTWDIDGLFEEIYKRYNV